MNLKPVIAACGAGLLLSASIAQSGAQQDPQVAPPGQSGQQAGAQGGPGFGQGGQGRFGFGGPMVLGGPMGMGSNNPLLSNPMALIQRSEVQQELHLDLKQKKAIDELIEQSRTGMREQMQKAMQGVDFQQLRSLSPEQRQSKLQEMQPQIQAAMQLFQGDLTEKMKAILKPDQTTRLYQLDKQRRGPMAMADPKVADELKLPTDLRQELQKIVQEYQSQQGLLMREAFESMQQNGGQPPQLPDFTSKLSPWKQKMDKIRKASDEKVMSVLEPDERAAWKSAIGDPFTFRADPPVQQGGRVQFRGPGGL